MQTLFQENADLERIEEEINSWCERGGDSFFKCFNVKAHFLAVVFLVSYGNFSFIINISREFGYWISPLADRIEALKALPVLAQIAITYGLGAC